MGLILRYTFCFLVSGLSHIVYRHFYISVFEGLSVIRVLISWISISYCLTYFTNAYRKDGEVSKWIQKLKVWKILLSAVLDSFGIEAEEKLDDTKQYIFASFPHGATTSQHFLTMTNSCGFFDKVYAGPKRDLAATVLFLT